MVEFQLIVIKRIIGLTRVYKSLMDRIDSYLLSKYLTMRYWIITKGKTQTLQWKIWHTTTWQSDQLTSPAIRQLNICYLQIRCTETNTISLVLYSCQNVHHPPLYVTHISFPLKTPLKVCFFCLHRFKINAIVYSTNWFTCILS